MLPATEEVVLRTSLKTEEGRGDRSLSEERSQGFKEQSKLTQNKRLLLLIINLKMLLDRSNAIIHTKVPCKYEAHLVITLVVELPDIT